MKVKLGIAALLLVAAVAGFLYWNSGQQRAQMIANGVPEIPSEGVEHPDLSRRLQKATSQAKEGPNALEGLRELSSLYHANGFTNQAWQCYTTLIAVEPREAKWPYLFAKILAGYGQLEEATPLYRRATELQPTYLPVHIRLADSLLKQNRVDEAQTAYEQAIMMDPDNPYALVGLSRVAIAREDWPTARTHLEKAVTASNFQIGADLLGDVYEKLGLKTKEQIILQNIQWGSYADIPDAWSLSLMDDSYDAYQLSIAGGWVAHQGDVQTGLRYIRRAVELAPDNATYHYQIAGIYLSLEQIDKAEEHFKRTVELQPDFADAWLSLIEIAKRRQSPTTVRRTLEAAIAASPDSPSLQIEKGKLYLSQGRVEQAIPYFQKSIELRPYEAVGFIELAKAYLAADRVPEAMEQMGEALRLEPNHPVALTAMAFDAIMARDQERADRWFQEMKKQSRLRSKEIEQLQSMYQKTFGSLPPRG